MKIDRFTAILRSDLYTPILLTVIAVCMVAIVAP